MFTVPGVVVGLTNNLTLTPAVDPLPICEGSSVQLQLTTNATQFAWTPSTSLIVATLGRCTTTDDILVTVMPAPKADERTHLILPTHRALDKAAELSKGNQKIGSTLKGIAPTYMDKTGRNGLRVDITAWEEEFFEALEFLRQLNIVNGEYFINDQLQKGKRVLAEGAQGSMLDIDFGTFPFVTSSNTISAGVCSGLGIAPQKIRDVIGVTKAYCTRVGSGPFPTELEDATGEELRKIGNEFGATTGRPRRCGWIDLVALHFACMVNGVTKIVMTKADVLDAFKDLQ
ncbi:adenylosuccinate synthase, partial [Ostertagia ostertagi]